MTARHIHKVGDWVTPGKRVLEYRPHLASRVFQVTELIGNTTMLLTPSPDDSVLDPLWTADDETYWIGCEGPIEELIDLYYERRNNSL